MFGKRRSGRQTPSSGCRPPNGPPDLLPFPSPSAGLTATSVSLIGGRDSQQDALDHRTYPDGSFAAAVCDGMGGLNGGAMASRTACLGFFSQYDALPAFGSEGPDLARIARRLDLQVKNLRDSSGMPLDGGSTLTGIVIKDGYFHWVSVGDSRIGLVREGRMYWLNRLHNYRLELDEALRAGELSRAEYEAELPKGHALLSYLGCGGLTYIDHKRGQRLAPGDMLILCSDGFYDLLPEPALLSILADLGPDLSRLPRLLEPYLGQATKRMDNASAVIIRYT